MTRFVDVLECQNPKHVGASVGEGELMALHEVNSDRLKTIRTSISTEIEALHSPDYTAIWEHAKDEVESHPKSHKAILFREISAFERGEFKDVAGAQSKEAHYQYLLLFIYAACDVMQENYKDQVERYHHSQDRFEYRGDFLVECLKTFNDQLGYLMVDLDRLRSATQAAGVAIRASVGGHAQSLFPQETDGGDVGASSVVEKSKGAAEADITGMYYS